ncbi:uncharacterized protein LOC144086306 [Stigmatopora argus]
MDRKVLGIFLCVQAFLLITAVNSDKGEGQPQQEETQWFHYPGPFSILFIMGRPESDLDRILSTYSPLARKEGPPIEPDPIVVTSSPVSGKPGPESDEMQPQNTTPN